MSTSTLKKIYAKNIALIRFLFSLLVNGFTFFGIIVWRWNFFTVIYLYWAEEVIRIFFRLIENRIDYSKNRISKSEFQLNNKATLTMFFPMGIYFVFIVVIVGIITAPNSDAVIANLFTVFLRNIEFNLNLLLALITELGVLVFLFRKYNKNKSENQSKSEIQENLEREFLRKQQEAAINYQNKYKGYSSQDYQQNQLYTQNQVFSTQMIVLHLSIILGTFLYFAANTDKLPIQINLGAAGEFAFVIVFAAIQTIAEVLVFVKARKK